MTDETKGPEKPAKKKKDVDALMTEVTGVTIGRAKPAPKTAAVAPAKAVEAPAPAPVPAPRVEIAPKPAEPPKKIRLRQIRSGICTPVDQKDTLRGLGLTRIRQEVVRLDTPSLRGQVHKVRHLVVIIGEAS